MIVVGTNPAGLAAAYLLRKRGHRVVLVERPETAYGMWAGTNDKLHHFESGYQVYANCGTPEIDEFFLSLPVPRHVLSGDDQPTAGLYYQGKLQTNCPYPDLRGERDRKAMLGETLLAAAFNPDAADRALDRATALWGEVVALRHVKPILEKIYGTTHLKARAIASAGLDRMLLLAGAEAADLMTALRINARLAAEVPHYVGTHNSIYVEGGMDNLARAAISSLESMGVEVITCGQSETLRAIIDAGERVIWADHWMDLRTAIGRPYDLPHRMITQVNLSAGGSSVPPVHSLRCLDPHMRTLRVVLYGAFTFHNLITVELLNTEPKIAEAVARDELARMGIARGGVLTLCGIHERRGETLPSAMNDQAADAWRPKLGHVTLIGHDARNGLDTLPQVLRHAYITVNCYTESADAQAPAQA